MIRRIAGGRGAARRRHRRRGSLRRETRTCTDRGRPSSPAEERSLGIQTSLHPSEWCRGKVPAKSRSRRARPSRRATSEPNSDRARRSSRRLLGRSRMASIRLMRPRAHERSSSSSCNCNKVNHSLPPHLLCTWKRTKFLYCVHKEDRRKD